MVNLLSQLNNLKYSVVNLICNFSVEQKAKVLDSIEKLGGENVDRDYISLALAAACLDISSATSESTLLVI